MTQQGVIYDADTGERVGIMLPDSQVRGRRPVAKRFTTPYLTVFQPGLLLLLSEDLLSPTQLRVFLAICATAPYDQTEWTAPTDDLAGIVGTSRSTIQRALKRLVETDVIRRPSRGKIALNPVYAWRGAAQHRELMIRKVET